MLSYEVTCIKKSGGLLHGNQNKITHIGYIDGGNTVHITVQHAIQMIQNNQCTFYVKKPSNQDRISVVVIPQNGLFSRDSYLRTIANGVETDNLEQLPEC